MKPLAHFSSAHDATAAAAQLVHRFMFQAVPSVTVECLRAQGARRGRTNAAAVRAAPPAAAAAAPDGGVRPHNTAVVVFDYDDTLMRGNGEVIADVVALARTVGQWGARVHIVTAREDALGQREETEAELRDMGVAHERLWMTTSAQERSWEAISQWKHSVRAAIQDLVAAPVVLSVGDVFGDMTLIPSKHRMDALEAARQASVHANLTPAQRAKLDAARRSIKAFKYTLYRLGNAETQAVWGLKLPEQFRVDAADGSGATLSMDEEELDAYWETLDATEAAAWEEEEAEQEDGGDDGDDGGGAKR